MARYTEKSSADIAWDEIRREAEYRLNIEAAHWKARKKNEVLPALQDRFEKALNRGTLLSLEAGAGVTIDEILEEARAEARG